MEGTQPGLLIFDQKLLEEREYWINKLNFQRQESGLSLDYPGLQGHAGKSGGYEFKLDGDLYQKMVKLTGGGVFLTYTTMMAALKVCLYKYTGNRTVVVGSPARKQDSG